MNVRVSCRSTLGPVPWPPLRRKNVNPCTLKGGISEALAVPGPRTSQHPASRTGGPITGLRRHLSPWDAHTTFRGDSLTLGLGRAEDKLLVNALRQRGGKALSSWRHSSAAACRASGASFIGV